MFARRPVGEPQTELVRDFIAALDRGIQSLQAPPVRLADLSTAANSASAFLIGISDIRRTSHSRVAAIPHPELPLKGARERRARLAFRSDVTQH
jgi:hypothetical protein